ncbi:hypothetical protein ACLK1Z_03610 [Escherichia coli]
MCPDDEVRVADAEGNPLPQREVGRLMTRGGHLPWLLQKPAAQCQRL